MAVSEIFVAEDGHHIDQQLGNWVARYFSGELAHTMTIMTRCMCSLPLGSSNMASWNIPELNGAFQLGKSLINLVRFPVIHVR